MRALRRRGSGTAEEGTLTVQACSLPSQLTDTSERHMVSGMVAGLKLSTSNCMYFSNSPVLYRWSAKRLIC